VNFAISLETNMSPNLVHPLHTGPLNESTENMGPESEGPDFTAGKNEGRQKDGVKSVKVFVELAFKSVVSTWCVMQLKYFID